MSEETDDGSYFLKENKLLRILPNFSQIENYADAYINEIKRIFIFSIEENQFMENFNYGLKLLKMYIRTYYYRITKDDFISIIQMLYSVLIIKDIDVTVLLNVLAIFKQMMKHRNISRDDLVIDWQPLYDLWYYHNYSSKAKNGLIYTTKIVAVPLSDVIRLCSKYFPFEATEEIWNFSCPYLYDPYPYNCEKYNGMRKLNLFLPFYYENREPFFKFIWPRMIQLLDMQTWSTDCEHDLHIILSRAAMTYTGLIDWSPYLDRFFTALLRSLKIKVCGITKRSKFNSTKLYVEILIYSIYKDDKCNVISKFRQLFQAISHLYHPSSAPQNSTKLFSLVNYITTSLLTRLQFERIRQKPHSTVGFYSEEFFLSDNHISQMVEIILPSCTFAIFTKNRSDYSLVLQSIQRMGNLAPELVIPNFLELFHDSSAETILQPHRTLSVMVAVSMFHVPLLNSPQRYPEGKLAVFPLMRQLINYININDLPKSYVAMLCFGNLANMLWIEDLSEKAMDSELTDLERKIALATTQFEDLILQFFDKIFEIIEIGFSETGMVETQKTSEFRVDTLLDIVVMTIPSICTEISKQVLDKAIDFVFSHSFSNKSIQSFLTSIFSCILEKDALIDYTIQRFVPKYMRYFRECIKDDCLLLGERLDIKFVWLSNLFPGFMKGGSLNMIQTDLLEVMESLSTIYTKDAIKLFDVLMTFSLYICCQTFTSLEIIHQLKDRDFYKNSWSGLLSKKDIIRITSSDKFKVEYISPGEDQKKLLEIIVDKFVRPGLHLLTKFSSAVTNRDGSLKLEPNQLRSTCHKLFTICHNICEYMLDVDEEYYDFGDYSQIGPLPKYSPVEFEQFRNCIGKRKNQYYVELIQEIRETTVTAMQSVICIVTDNENSSFGLPVTITDLEDLFRLLVKVYDVSKISSCSQNRAFLDRRFDSFTDPCKKRVNTPLNWMMLFDWWYCDCVSDNFKPVTKPVIEIIDMLFPLICLSNSAIQLRTIDSILNLAQIYLQLDEYLIDKCFKLIVSFKEADKPIDEHTHNGVSQLAFKLFMKRTFLSETMTFTYKLVSVFVSLCKSQHIEKRNSRNWNKKIFKLLVQQMTTFYVTKPSICSVDTLMSIGNKLRSNTTLYSTELKQDLIQCYKGPDMISLRRQLYYNCIDHCISVFLDVAPVNDVNTLSQNSNSDGFLHGLVRYNLKSTSTWQNTLQMTTVLPLHPEVPLPVRFVELFLLILFNPSKELSSQACNQINISVWILKQKSLKNIVPRSELDVTINSDNHIESGPREDNRFMTIERDTDFWSLPTKCYQRNINSTYLFWPEKIKMRSKYPDETILHSDAMNAESWQLICKVFESDKFHAQLCTFLLDLGSQFLREEETANMANNNMIEFRGASGNGSTSGSGGGGFGVNLGSLFESNSNNSTLFGTFAIENLVNSILICIGVEKGLSKIMATYETLIKCSTFNQIYAHKIASKIIYGVLLSTKYWPRSRCQEFFNKDLLNIMDMHLENACKNELSTLGFVTIEVTTTSSVDIRQLIPLYRHLLSRLSDRMVEHQPFKEAVCLEFIVNFAKICSWCLGGSIAVDMVELWRKYVSSPFEKVRKEAGKIMKFLLIYKILSNQFYFSTEVHKIVLMNFSDEVKHTLALQTRTVLLEKGLKSNNITSQALNLKHININFDLDIKKSQRAIDFLDTERGEDIEGEEEEEEDERSSDNFATNTPSDMMSTPLESPPNELDMEEGAHEESDALNGSKQNGKSIVNGSETDGDISDGKCIAHKMLATMIYYMTDSINKMNDCVDPCLIEMFSIVIDLIPVRDKPSLYSHLRHCALVVSNIFIGISEDDSYTLDKYGHRQMRPNSILDFLQTAVKHSSWRVRMVAARMMQFISFNNLFVISRDKNLSILVDMVFQLLIDSQLEVRKEAGVVFSGLIQCSMYKVDAKFVSAMTERIKPMSRGSFITGSVRQILLNQLSEKNKPEKDSLVLKKQQDALLWAHSGIIGLCALIQAHPFDIPPLLPETLTVLCRSITFPEPLASTIRDTLARFKKSHQETWHLERHKFTEDQLCALTDVLISPSYYA